MRTLLAALLILVTITAFAQNPRQTIRGTIIDEDTQLPLVGATVVISGTDTLTGATTNNKGEFRISKVPAGRVNLKVTYIGYGDKTISNIEVSSAKEVVLTIGLSENSYKLNEVIIAAPQNRGNALNDLALVSARSVSAEQTSRYAVAMNDPARIASAFAGVATSTDGGNEIIIRGNSPKYVQWRLEGAQISNPNHFGDLNSVSGIVNSLNNTLLSTSDFYTGAFPAGFGNALAGVYDIRMRKGNNEKFEGIFGLGILGTDITLEGPFKKGYNGSYLVNYRNSTLGLVTDLGLVDMDVDLKFQDASFKLWLPTDRFGAFSIFGLQGKSSFLFGDVDPGVWIAPGEDFARTTTTKDYKKGAYLLNTGANHTINISPAGYLVTTFLYSEEGIKDRVYEKTGPQEPESLQRLNFNSDMVKRTYRANSVYNHKINAQHKIDAGIRFAVFNQDMEQSMPDDKQERMKLLDFNENIRSLSSFINWKYRLNEKFTIVSGIHNTNVLFNNNYTLEPRFAINYNLSNSGALSFGYGNHSTMESIHNYFARVQESDGSFTTPNLDLGLLRANHYILGYERYITENIRLKSEVYYQDLYNIPVENNESSSYSTLNEGLELKYVDLVNKGTGKNYGVELTLERFLSRGYYALFNVSLYESKYTALDGVERNTRFNGNYLVNVLGGKEFSGLGRKNNQILSLNTKAYFGGGRYIVPLLRDTRGNVAADVAGGRIYDYSKAYQSKLDELVNISISARYKWNKIKTTHELYLTIDNVTNNQARVNEFYDARKADGIGYERQVGLTPNLLYRIYF